jgi:hypothetical protein
MGFDSIERHAVEVSGLTVEEIRQASPSGLRQYLVEKNQKGLSFNSEFPAIGRGNVLRDIITSKELNGEIDATF